VTGTAAWLASVCAVMSKDPFYGPILNDRFAMRFASAISGEAPRLLAEYDDDARREQFIHHHEFETPRSVTIVCYRKPIMEQQAREALEATGADQLVVMGAGCDSLSLRLAATGHRPAVYEIDRPAVIDYRARVIGGVTDVDHSHIHGVGVDFDHQTFGEVLIEKGYDPTKRAVFFAEGLLGYVQPEAVDEIFRFIKEQSAPGSRFVFSFTENRRKDAANRAPGTETLDAQGEEPVFDLPPSEVEAFVQARGFRMIELLTSSELKARYKTLHDGRIRITPFMHLAVAET